LPLFVSFLIQKATNKKVEVFTTTNGKLDNVISEKSDYHGLTFEVVGIEECKNIQMHILENHDAVQGTIQICQ